MGYRLYGRLKIRDKNDAGIAKHTCRGERFEVDSVGYFSHTKQARRSIVNCVYIESSKQNSFALHLKS